MGLEGVDLVIECEDRFGISIDDREAEACLTVGDLQDLVVQKLAGPRSNTCLTRHVFYRLRRALARAEAIPRHVVRPDTQLRTILPELNEPRWTALGNSAALRLPPLGWPGWATGSVAGSLVVGSAAVIAGAVRMATWPLAVLVALGSAAVLVLTLRLRPATELPRGVSTMGDLTRRVLSINLGELRRGGTPSDAETRDAVRETVCEVLGVRREQAVPEAQFVRDLGVG